jgi:hypothetical protein
MAYGYTMSKSESPAIPPESLGRKGEGIMDDEDFNSIVMEAMSQSVQFVDTELSYERARATEMYLGKPFGNEEEGRSQAIMTELRDAVSGALPSFLRVLFGADHVVEFVPNNAKGVDAAAQATDYVRYVVEEQNAGFLQALSVIKDGLIRKLGIYKWVWDTSEDTKAYKLQNLTKEQVEDLAADDEVDLKEVKKLPPTKQATADYEAAKTQFANMMKQHAAMAAQPQQPGAQTPPAPQPPPPPIQLHDVQLTRTIKGGRVKIYTLPPEEFIFNREARSIDTALLVAHRTDKTRGELIAMGVDEEDIDEYGGMGGDVDVTLKANAEEIARRDVAGIGRVVGYGFTQDPEMGEANRKILYCEAYITMDYDGDGIAELRKVCTLGPTYYPIKNDPVSERPFAIFTPDPEPHALIGGSWGDRLMDMQRITSMLVRGMLDSLSASIFPRTAYLEGQASVADIMNTAVGAPIRERVSGAVRTLETPFIGKEAMPVLSFMQDVIERRTGQEKGAQGLDADALQSTTKEGVGASLTAAQGQTEMMLRIFAESAFKPLFRGILRLLIENQPRAQMVRLRGQWTEVNPKSWDADMDVTVNIGLGTTFIDNKVSALLAVAAEQKDILTTYGPNNPMVTVAQYRDTLAQMLKYRGLPNADAYFKQVDPNWQPPAPPSPQPTPEQVQAQAQMQIENMKATKDLAVKKDQLALEEKKMDLDHAFKLRELAVNAELKRYAIHAQFHMDYTQANMDDDVKREIAETDATIAAHTAIAAHGLAAAGQAHDQALATVDQAHSHAMDQAQMEQDNSSDDTGGDSTGA